MISGVIISDIIAFICFAIFPIGFFYPGDIQMTIGSIIGTRFALKYRKSNEYVIPFSIITGLSGTFLAALSFSSFVWIIALIQRSEGFYLLLPIIVPYILVAIIIGILVGILIGIYYVIKSRRAEKEPLIDEEFYESLK